MLSHGLQSLFTDVPVTVVGMMIFFIAFLAFAAHLIWRGADAFVPHSQLPLQNEEICDEQ